MKFSVIFFLSLCFSPMLIGQFVQAELGADYVNQHFYNLESQENTVVNSESWDLAFTAYGFQDAGVSINEAAGLQGSALEVYVAESSDFSSDIVIANLEEVLFNSDQSWDAGAFNNMADPMNPFDYGWGVYDPQSMSVIGNKVFIIKLRDGNYKKFMIESLVVSTYNLRYADLDGSNEQTASFDKMMFPTEDLVFFSFESDGIVSLVDHSWDLLFTRYSSPVPDVDGTLVDYIISGVLLAPGIEAAELRDIDPSTAEASDYESDFTSQSDVIGYDWKEFDLTEFVWKVFEDLSYYVKTEDGDVYQLVFIDFEGSSTGIITFMQTAVGSTSSIDLSSSFQLSLFPNPNNGNFQLDLEDIEDGIFSSLEIFNSMGQRLFISDYSNVVANNFRISSSLEAGNYLLVLSGETGNMTQRFIVK